jgi:alkaline phosphatase D
MRSTRLTGVSRRLFLQQAASAAVVLPALKGCGSSALPNGVAGIPTPEIRTAPSFKHGIASGDPQADRVVLWTRLTPPTGLTSVPVQVRVFRDAGGQMLLGSQSALAELARDYTVKIDFTGLQAGTTYYYQFDCLGVLSQTGRTRTLPAVGVQRVRLGVVACSDYSSGFFNAYAALAKRADVDAILHLGDYFYEGSGGVAGREHVPNKETTTLEDYRTRHGQYKTDPDLLELHRQFPFITIWDDHESTNNSYRNGASNHTEGAPPAGEGMWDQRKAWAQQAYFEWLPIRENANGSVDLIYRQFVFGDLIDLLMLDTRLQRDQPPADFPRPCEPALTDPARQMLGTAQEAWFTQKLRTSTTRWRVVGSGVMFGQWKVAGAPNGMTCGGQFLNSDQWDGYQAARSRVFATLAGGNGQPAVLNNVFLAGDIHSSWALDLTEDPNNPTAYNPVTGAGTRAVEFVCNSITSDFPIPGDSGNAFLSANPAIKYIQTALRGYLLLDITPAAVTGEFYTVAGVATRSATETFARAYRSTWGAQTLVQTTATTPPGAAPLAG